MAEERYCTECGNKLPADVPQGQCPQCLMKLGLPTGADADRAAASDDQSDVPTSATPPAGFVPPEPAELADQFPQLEILELLGQGGMGAVYKARQKQLDRLVALKILPPQIGETEAFAERFTREARSLAKLNHPRIVSVHDSGHTETGLYYFIMEFVDGTDLRRVIQAGELSPAEALAIVPQVCEALQYAHEEGIVHRDVKPENILLDKKGRVKIADFGLAKLLDRPATVYTLTQAGQRMGTPHYMAPEQIEHPGQVDHRADIYSLGVVFYEMLTGQLPIGQFAPPSQKVQVDVRLDKVVLKSLAYEPERRYQHASEVKTEVETISGIPTSTAMRKFGYEYSSKTKLFGWPMLHIATGFDTVTGRKRVAKGIIAFGDVAVGVVACGGVALGGFTFGGVGIGVVAFAGVALGLLLALGGFAIGSIAFGGAAVGLIAMGGEMVGYCTYDAGKWQIGAGDTATPGPQAVAFTEFWAKSGFRLFVGIFLAIPIMVLIVWLAIWIKELVRGKTHVETISAKSKREPGMLFGIKIEDHLKIVTYIRIGIGSLFLVTAIVIFSALAIPGTVSGDRDDMAILSAFGFAFALLPLALAVPNLVGGVGLIKRRRRARILVLIVSGLDLFAFPVGTAIGIYTIWVLMQKETIQLFVRVSAGQKEEQSTQAKKRRGKLVFAVVLIVAVFLFASAFTLSMKFVWPVIVRSTSNRQSPQISVESFSSSEQVSQLDLPYGSFLSSEQVSQLDLPYGAPEDLTFGPEGPTLSGQCIQTLELEPSEAAQVHKILRRAYGQYFGLERQNTKQNRAANILTVKISPFREEAERFLEQLWADLDSILDEQKRTLARRHLPLGQMFGTFQFGGPEVTISVTEMGGTFIYSTLYKWPKGKSSIGGKGSGDMTGSGRTLPPKYRRFWEETATDK